MGNFFRVAKIVLTPKSKKWIKKRISENKPLPVGGDYSWFNGIATGGGPKMQEGRIAICGYPDCGVDNTKCRYVTEV